MFTMYLVLQHTSTYKYIIGVTLPGLIESEVQGRKGYFIHSLIHWPYQPVESEYARLAAL